ncbi:unnamed protein product [Chilo suppressalis]|uniref:Uncharacterized protein n=1 Tax=Chilo suppressalis TaxID=168631 RepID=A0ABN8B0E0_CHISP|nr:unnamed protein product [Chilo suppressalis]
MASTCIHDNRMVCASTPDGCNRRSFLDQCDMYEFNCDYGTRYQETYLLLCSAQTPNLPEASYSGYVPEPSHSNETDKCCDRPKKWETTKETTPLVVILQDSSTITTVVTSDVESDDMTSRITVRDPSHGRRLYLEPVKKILNIEIKRFTPVTTLFWKHMTTTAISRIYGINSKDS